MPLLLRFRFREENLMCSRERKKGDTDGKSRGEGLDGGGGEKITRDNARLPCNQQSHG